MDVKPGGRNDVRLLCNRSLAFAKVGKYAEAALDAGRACELGVHWSKARFRLGTAQLGAGDAKLAVDNFSAGLSLDPTCKEMRAALRRAINRLTREEVAAKLLAMIDDAQSRGLLAPPSFEDVPAGMKLEAMFRHIQQYQRDKPTPGDYYDYLMLWSEVTWNPGARVSLVLSQPATAWALSDNQRNVGIQEWRTFIVLRCTTAQNATAKRWQTLRRL
jgi:hypothetical protein